MIDAILTGMTGRITTLNRVEPVRSVKQQEQEQELAPESLDSVSLSSEAVELYSAKSVTKVSEAENYTEDTDPSELTEEEQEEVDELAKRDKEVRAHEQAHQSSGAPYTSSPKYEYTTGPDNRKYATGGEVDVDTSEESTPEKTIQKAQKIKQSASAPAEPSAQDRKVAAAAAQMEQKARAELREKQNSSRSFGIQAYMQNSAPSVGSYVNMSS